MFMSADDFKPEQQPSAPLLDAFAPITYSQWRQLVDSELAGGSFEQKLIAHTYEGIDLLPMYWPHDSADLPFIATLPGQPPFLRGTQIAPPPAAPWRICQSIRTDTPTEANRLARLACTQGATALHLAPRDPQSLIETLSGIDTEAITLFIASAPDQALPLAQTFATKPFQGAIGSDPLAAMASGEAIDLEAAWNHIAQVTNWAVRQAPHVATIAADGLIYYESGASAVEELAFTMASAVEQIRALAQHGLGVELSGPRVRFSFALGTQLFMEIAKLRAARILWSKIIVACGLAAETAPAIIHAQSGIRTFTIADPHVNLLRASTQAFAAIIGGCTSLEISPFDAAIQQPDDFSRRLALNTQHLLREESLLGHVIDPAGGSWYVEALTDAVARKAWDLFQEVELRGGLNAALRAGWPRQQIQHTAAKRAKNIASRRDILVGTNMYANPLEAPPAITNNQQATNQPAPTAPFALHPHRDAEPFEALRARAHSGSAPPQEQEVERTREQESTQP
jgi:methylmalonyl-CoA mutase